MTSLPRILTVFVAAASVWAGCASSTDDGASADGAAITSTSCRIFNNQTGKAITADELTRLDDPIAKKLLAGSDACPGSYTEALTRLKANDNQDCKDPNGAAQSQGLGSFFVSEEAEFAASDDDAAKNGFRTVITKTCEGRKPDEMLFSSSASIDSVGDTSVEMIGKDATTGVYNFYEVLPGNQWVFYGSSADFVGNGYDCSTSGFCKSLNSKRASSPSRKSCSSCHISGGLVMKELESPWLHWTAGHQKGSEPVAQKFPDKLGNENRGENLETQVVRASFDAYNDRRVGILAAKGVQELVRPLFCTMDINLHSGIDSSIFLDSAIDGSPLTIDDDNSTYTALKKEVGQRIVGAPDSVDDTAEGFTFPIRGQIDGAYGEALKRAKLVDDELLQDILNVDFTRPIFSPARCALVDAITGKTSALDAKLATYAKEPDPSKREALAADLAKDIPAVFVDALGGSAKPSEQKLVSNLTDAGQTKDQHDKDALAFVAACQKRLDANKHDALKDIMTYAAHLRSVMRRDIQGFNGQELLEPGQDGDDKMPFDDLEDTPNALDPTTCNLTLAP
jgi:hypothetical protein